MGFTGAHVLILSLYLLYHGYALLKYTCKTSSINPHLVTVLHEWLQPAHGRPVPPWQLSRVNWSASSQAAALTTESPSSSSASPSSSFGRGQIFFAKPSRRPDICHFFSTNVLLGSIFLHMKARKNCMNFAYMATFSTSHTCHMWGISDFSTSVM